MTPPPETHVCPLCQKERPLLAFLKPKGRGYFPDCADCRAANLPPSITEQVCETCNETKPISAFRQIEHTPGAYQKSCKVCRRVSPQGAKSTRPSTRKLRPGESPDPLQCGLCDVLKPPTDFASAHGGQRRSLYCVACSQTYTFPQHVYNAKMALARRAARYPQGLFRCYTCGVEKAATDFKGTPTNPRKVSNDCKECKAALASGKFTGVPWSEAVLKPQREAARRARNEIRERPCGCCHKIKPPNAFSRYKREFDLPQSYCKTCSAVKARQRNAKNGASVVAPSLVCPVCGEQYVSLSGHIGRTHPEQRDTLRAQIPVLESADRLAKRRRTARERSGRDRGPYCYSQGIVIPCVDWLAGYDYVDARARVDGSRIEFIPVATPGAHSRKLYTIGADTRLVSLNKQLSRALRDAARLPYWERGVLVVDVPPALQPNVHRWAAHPSARVTIVAEDTV